MSIVAPISPAAALRAAGFVGRVVEPGDPDFDLARAGWNGAVDRRPSAVAYATDVDDVAAAIRTGLECTVRGGGHSVSGRSVRDGALLLDLRGLAGVEVDPEREVVRVGGGALLGELDAATQAHGLAVPAGQISHTGVGGLTLGGGMGWLMRRHGLTVDSLLSAEVVLTDGEIVRASERSDPDLFWALRGGGGDFGVVTEFEFRAHRVGPTVLAGLLIHPWERAAAAFRAARGLMADAPEDLTVFAVLVNAPPEPPFPVEVQGGPVAVIAIAWCGDPAEGRRLLAPVREGCVADLVGEMPYVALQSMLDATAPHGWSYYDRLHYLPEVSDDFVDALLARFEQAPTPQTHVMTSWLGGAIDRVAPGETAFGHRRARALSWFIGCATDGELEPVVDWVRGTWEATTPFAAGGVYVNALEAGRSARDAYAEPIWERLVDVKRRYDPEGRFQGNGIA